MTAARMTSARQSWVDSAKAIGIVLVVYGHVARGAVDAGANHVPASFGLVDSVIYSFHMPLFFCLAGLFAAASYERRGAGGMIVEKLLTVGVPYVVWSLVQGLLEVWAGDLTNGSTGYRDVFALLWAPRSQFWFLYALFLCFGLYVAARLLFARHGAIVLATLALLLYFQYDAIYGARILPALARSLVYFCFGVLCAALLRRRLPTGAGPLAVAAGVFIAAQYLFHGVLQLRHDDYGVAALLLALVSIAVVAVAASAAANLESRMLAAIGEASMTIYVMHVIVGAGLRVFLMRVVGIDDFAVDVLLGVLAGVLVPLLTRSIARGARVQGVAGAAIGIPRRADAR